MDTWIQTAAKQCLHLSLAYTFEFFCQKSASRTLVPILHEEGSTTGMTDDQKPHRKHATHVERKA